MLHQHILPRFGSLAPVAITANAVERWHGSIAQTTPVRANRCLQCLSAFMAWLKRDKRIAANPCAGIARVPENERHVYLTPAETEKAHAALDRDPDRFSALALRLALMTGCRISEALDLSADQVHMDRRVWIKQAYGTKQKRLHAAPLPKAAIPIVEELLALKRDRGSIEAHPRTAYNNAHHCWSRVREEIGREDVKIHDLRHSRASAIAAAGGSLLQIAKLLGHTDLKNTKRYTHLFEDELAALVDRAG